jgi:hypothetical protein
METLADIATLTVVRNMADRLGVSIAYLLRGELHLPLGQPGWTIAVKPDSADRVRVCTCEYARPRDMKWTTTTDRERHFRLVDQATEVMVNEKRERARGPA